MPIFNCGRLSTNDSKTLGPWILSHGSDKTGRMVGTTRRFDCCRTIIKMYFHSSIVVEDCDKTADEEFVDMVCLRIEMHWLIVVDGSRP